METAQSLTRYLFSDLTLKEIKRLIILKEQRVTLDTWFKDEQMILSAEEKQQLAYLVKHLLPYETTLMNEATIWGRAIYPLLMMAEKDELQAWAEVSLEAEFSRFKLHGIADAVIGKCQAGVMDVPYIVVIEGKRGLEAKNPRFQLYGELLAIARLNWETEQQPSTTVFGCYTIADSWTFIRSTVTEIEQEMPRMSIESTREYVEKFEAETLLKILKYFVQMGNGE
ncbi:MAG TPA: hypothetical protein ENG03_03845 [Thioploca sp.]|nr:MAG: hypothetical protein DRR19_16470 [Gammaproteobacteria bacterium]HDN26224.1 hypothetical protein [Thioploca sp.]